MSGYTSKKIIRGRLGTKTNQTGMKMSGCPSFLGRKPTINRYIRRRVNCMQSTCGAPMLQGRIWRDSLRNHPPFCKYPVSDCLAAAGGIGNINTPYYRTPAPKEKGCYQEVGSATLTVGGGTFEANSAAFAFAIPGYYRGFSNGPSFTQIANSVIKYPNMTPSESVTKTTGNDRVYGALRGPGSERVANLIEFYDCSDTAEGQNGACSDPGERCAVLYLEFTTDLAKQQFDAVQIGATLFKKVDAQEQGAKHICFYGPAGTYDTIFDYCNGRPPTELTKVNIGDSVSIKFIYS